MSRNSCRFSAGSSYRGCIVSLSILVLSSCAIQPPITDTERQGLWTSHQDSLRDLHDWNLTGRMSFRNDTEAWSASLYWREQAQHYQIQIVAPLGQGGVEITGDGETVSLSTDDGQTFREDEVELMMLQNLGWRVPASAMRYWVKGIPEPDSVIDEMETDDLGRLLQLTQSDWSIYYQSYTRVDGYQLPARIDLHRDESSIRMIINYWNLSP